MQYKKIQKSTQPNYYLNNLSHYSSYLQLFCSNSQLNIFYVFVISGASSPLCFQHHLHRQNTPLSSFWLLPSLTFTHIKVLYYRMKKLSLSYGMHLNATRFKSNLQESSIQQSNTSSKPVQLEDTTFEKQGFNYCQILGSINNSLILCSFHQNIYAIDQHAASQKSLYVRFLDEKNLFPKDHQGSPFQVENIYKGIISQEECKLKNLGWTFQILEQGPVFFKIKLTSVPSIYHRKCSQNEFLQILDSYYQKSLGQLSKSQKQSMATIACHNAYRFGDKLDKNEMRNLIDTLYEMDGAYNCPHNRPIVIMIGSVQNFKKQIFSQRQYSLF